jgi:hypothetical protein
VENYAAEICLGEAETFNINKTNKNNVKPPKNNKNGCEKTTIRNPKKNTKSCLNHSRRIKCSGTGKNIRDHPSIARPPPQRIIRITPAAALIKGKQRDFTQIFYIMGRVFECWSASLTVLKRLPEPVLYLHSGLKQAFIQ